MKIKVLSIFGTRPEAIKMAPVVKALESDPRFESIVCLTGQHREMLDQMVKLFDLTTHYDLEVMSHNQTLAGLTAKVISRLDKIMLEVKPDWVLVQGDTTTCFAAGLVAFYHKVKIGHVEAGLRTGDLQAPFPEEANRSLVGRIADLHFAPTDLSKQNLIQENISENIISVTGNTVIDALMWMSDKVAWQDKWSEFFQKSEQLINSNKNYVMVTGHRRENFGDGFLNICQALKELAVKYPAWHFIYPVHLNPNVQKPVYELLQGLVNIHLIRPLDYEPFIFLMKHSKIVLTDSGGVQEEAPSLGKPVLVMRDKTERPEGVDSGTAKLVGTDKDNIVKNVSKLIDSPAEYNKMANSVNPYGDGKAAKRIVDLLY